MIDYYLERYEDAVAKLKELKSDIAYYYIGQSYLKFPNKYTEAAGAFKKIAEQYPDSKYMESALYNKAESFYKGENYAVAVNDYENFLKKYPNSNLAPYARFKRGSSLFMTKKYDMAIKDFQQVLNGSGDERIMAYAQYLIGECYRLLKKYDAALLAYNQLQNYPKIHDAFSSSQLKSGWCYLIQGNFNKAESILTEFTNKFITHKDLPLGYYLLGTSSYNQKKYADAVASYKFLLDKFGYTDLTEAALLMTELSYYNQEQYSLLISDASHMLEIMSSKFQSPNQNIRARAYYYLGMAYYKLGMFGPATQAFKEIVDKLYDSDIVTEARANLAWCFYELENYKGARTMAKDVVSNPGISKDVKMACEILIAHSYFCEKNYERASLSYGEFAYNYAKTGNPDLIAEALFQQGKVYEIQEYYSDAIKSWQSLVYNYPKSKRAPEALYKISDLLFKAQQYDKALAGFQEILTRWPKDPIAEDAMLAIAEVYYNSDQEAKAVKVYEDFMKKYPDSKKVQSVEEGMQRADYRKAEKKEDPVMLIEFANKYPKSPLVVDALYKAGEIYYQTSKFQQAIDVFNRLIENYSNDSLAINSNYYIGACYEGMQNFEGAI
ncbi:MAG TPA: tetratricopeptide repeat protein, partial [Candidatus Goldiibacteriota bacterium]|nr:tetratricopeptide repeat protein [Candidatus Goldiibacteriota bacterium]